MNVNKTYGPARVSKASPLSHYIKEENLIYGEKKINCPIDSRTLLKVKVDGIIIDLCPHCSGIWFDKDELNRLLDSSITSFELLQTIQTDEEDNWQEKECPRCKKKLFKQEKKGIIIDLCRDCRGIWCDGGEFEKLYQLHSEAGTTGETLKAVAAHLVDLYI